MAPVASPGGTSVTPKQADTLRRTHGFAVGNGREGGEDNGEFYLPQRPTKDIRSMSNTSATFGPRKSSLAPSGPPPGSFTSELKFMNSGRNVVSRPDLNLYSNRDDAQADATNASERRQAVFKDKISKEMKIKIGSENLLEALMSKNAKQSKDQRLRVESELSSSNRKIIELKSLLNEEIERSKRPVTPPRQRLSGAFAKSPLRSPSRIEDTNETDEQEQDTETESPTFVLAEILQALEAEGEQPDYYVERANSLVELFKRYPTLKYDLAWAIFGLRMQTMLLSDSREVVAAGYRVTRHAMADRNSLRIIRALHTDELVILSLVKEGKATIEREQAMKFVRAFLDVKDGVREISIAVARTVVSVAEHTEDRLKNMAIMTLTEILIKNPELVSAAGGMASLIDSLAEGTYPGSEGLVSAILFIVDDPQQRHHLAFGREVEAPFALFTDPLSVHGHEERLKVNARSIAATLKAWPGLFALAQQGFSSLRSLLLSLFHPAPFARELILDLLFDILHIKPPSWTSSFLAGRRLTTYGRVTNLKEDQGKQFMSLAGGEDTTQVDLMEHYTTLILAILIDCGLLEVLSELIVHVDEISLRRKTSILLGEVLKLINYALPADMSDRLQTMASLINTASLQEGEEHDIITGIIYQVDSVNRTLYRSGKPSTASGAAFNQKHEKNGLLRAKDIGKNKLSVDMDDVHFRSLLVETQVLTTVNYLKWKWDLILELIEGPLLNPRRVDEAIKATKFLKRLIGFYRPFKYRFSDARNTKPNQRYVRIGSALMKSLLKTPEGVQYLTESKLLRQLAECLAQLDKVSGLTSATPLFSPHRISETLTGGYFTLLGTLSCDPKGLSMLGRWKMINMLYHILELHEREDLIRLSLGNMDFSLDSHLRVMISKALTSSTKSIRIFSTKLLRKYATSDAIASDPRNATRPAAYWAIRLLVTQLYDPEVEVSEVAVQILEEACNRMQYLEYVVRCRPALDHLGEIGAPLLLRFLSTSIGYQYLDGLDYITHEMDDWFLGRNEKYVVLVEASLSRAMSHQVERPKSMAEEPMQTQELGMLPPHFYRELARTSEGCKLLGRSRHFEDFTRTIGEFWSEKADNEIMLKVKGCLWAVGNIGSMELGARFLEESNVVYWIIKITEESEVMTMRGTAFFVLGLISRSLHGLEILAERGWDVANDQRGNSLGYCLPPSLGSLFSISIPKAPRSLVSRQVATNETTHVAYDDDPVKARILSLVVDLGNTVLTKRAAGELHAIKIKSPGILDSIPLFRKIMHILEMHSFRLPVRRFVIDLFDKNLMRQIVLEENSDDEDLESNPMTAKPFSPRSR
ncbi:hypothetical protein MMC09_004432 [Bachmanniomyces sp. S44760]|nr:hypothetical protein [Bachmanniomyces sp. S44760]